MKRPAAAALAVLVLGAIGWWLFRGDGGSPAGPPPEERAGASRPGDTVSPRDTPSAAAPGAKRTSPEDPGGGEEAAPAEVVERPTCEGLCVLEDGTPLAGVEFVARADLGDLPVATTSGLDGAFRIYRDLPTSVEFPTADPVSAEGGILAPAGKGVWTVTAIDRLRIVFRDRSWWAHVRLVNADTGNPVTKVAGLRVAWHLPGGSMSMRYAEDQAPGGWIPIPEGRLPETGRDDAAAIRVDVSKVEVEFALPGFEKGRLPLPDIRGRMELRVRPVPPDATGEVAVPRVIQSMQPVETRVSAALRWTGPDPAPAKEEVLGLPATAGPFSLYDLPDGSWVIEVASTLPDNTVVRGKKAFEKHGGTADLGTIELVPAGKVVIRVVDSAGEPIPQAWAVIVRPEENPDQGRRLDLNQMGMVAVGDLEPGVGHRVVVKGLPRDLEQTVVAAAEAKPVEFAWPEKLVPCRITLLVDGKAVANPDGRTTIPAVIQESPLPRDRGAWKADGTFEAKLVPGTYRFSALATPKEGGDLALFSGEVNVPSGDSFEVRLEMQRGNR